MFHTLSEEVEVKVPAQKAWDLYGSLTLIKMVAEAYFERLDVEGDGGAGTILTFISKPGSEVMTYKEKYTMVDNDKMMKEAEFIEGWYFDFGITLFRVRIEVKHNPNDKTGSSCLVKITNEYEVKEEAAHNASLITMEPYIFLMNFANEHLLSSS